MDEILYPRKRAQAPSCTETLDLFVQYNARETDPGTAHEAAAKRTAAGTKHFDEIVADIRAHGPSTYREVSDRIGVVGTTISTVMTQMERHGILKRTGERRNGCMLRGLA